MEYTHMEEAIRIVLDRLQEKSPELATLVQNAVDEGEFIEVKGAFKGKNGQPTHAYRKRTKLTDLEALEKVLSVLQSYFVELPMCVNAMAGDLTELEISTGPLGVDEDLPLFRNDNSAVRNQVALQGNELDSIQVCIDLGHEAMRAQREESSLLTLQIFSQEQIESQQKNLADLRALLLEQEN